MALKWLVHAWVLALIFLPQLSFADYEEQLKSMYNPAPPVEVSVPENETPAETPASPPVSKSTKLLKKKKRVSISYFGFEFRLDSIAKQGLITDAAGAKNAVFYRGVGFDVCLKGAHLFRWSPDFYDFVRFCAGYQMAQLESPQNVPGSFSYFEQNVNSFPLSIDPGVETRVGPNLFFFLNASIRMIIAQTAANSSYTLSQINSPHLGFEGGFDARLIKNTFFNIGFGSFFKNGFSFFTGVSTQL